MKLLTILLISLILLIPSQVLAQAQVTIEKTVITPDNTILYFFKKTWESIDLLFTFNKTIEVEKRLKYAEERLEEAKIMAQRLSLIHI